MIYFDNSATAPIDEEVYEAMLPYLKEEYGNPSSKYYCKAVNAKNAVEEARENVAQLIGATPEEIIFTAGATESTNFIIKGYMDYRKYYGDGKNHIITSVAEHKATLNVCKFLNGDIYSNNDPSTSLFGGKKRVDRGYEASFVDVNEFGQITVDTIKSEIKQNTAMVSALYVNNEVGTISDIIGVASICAVHGVAFHTDITQALGKKKIDVKEIGCDFASCSAHKIYGPKGIGVAYLKADAYGIPPITAFIHGGEQEQGFRAGTLSVHNIVGFGKAAEIAKRDFDKNAIIIQTMDEYLVGKLEEIEEASLTNPSKDRLSGIVSIIIKKKDFHNERFIKAVSKEVALSTGSACSFGEPSYVICSMGMADKVNNVLRISLNKNTTKDDIDKLMEIICKNI